MWVSAICDTRSVLQWSLIVILFAHLLRPYLAHPQGGAKAQEAAYIYDELIDKYGSSPSLLNGLAVSRMHLQQWDEAEGTLKEAITKVLLICKCPCSTSVRVFMGVCSLVSLTFYSVHDNMWPLMM